MEQHKCEFQSIGTASKDLVTNDHNRSRQRFPWVGVTANSIGHFNVASNFVQSCGSCFYLNTQCTSSHCPGLLPMPVCSHEAPSSIVVSGRFIFICGFRLTHTHSCRDDFNYGVGPSEVYTIGPILMYIQVTTLVYWLAI